MTENRGEKCWREGLTGADFQHIDLLPTCIRRGVETIKRQAATGTPFSNGRSTPGAPQPNDGVTKLY